MRLVKLKLIHQLYMLSPTFKNANHTGSGEKLAYNYQTIDILCRRELKERNAQ